MDTAETNVLADMTFPTQHRAKVQSINPLEQPNCAIRRHTEFVLIFPNEDAIPRRVDTTLLEQNKNGTFPKCQIHDAKNNHRDLR